MEKATINVQLIAVLNMHGEKDWDFLKHCRQVFS